MLLDKHLEDYGLDEHKKNILIAVVDNKLIEFLTRALGGKEIDRMYNAITESNRKVEVR